MWACIVDPVKAQDERSIFRDPMRIVMLARDSNVWPDQIEIPLNSLPPIEKREAWRKACLECLAHNPQSKIFLGDEEWDPQRPLQPRWPSGNPIYWPSDTLDAWDAETGCLTPEAGQIWWDRQPAQGPWVIGTLAELEDHPLDLITMVAALKEISGETAAIVREGPKKFWCAWTKTAESLSGAEWQKRLWAVLGTVRIGTAIVIDPSQWGSRRAQAINVAQNAPGKRIKSNLSIDQQASLKQSVSQKEEAMRQEQAEQEALRLEAERLARAKQEAEALERAAQEEAQRLEKAQREAERERLTKLQAERLAAERKVKQAQEKAERLRQMRIALEQQGASDTPDESVGATGSLDSIAAPAPNTSDDARPDVLTDVLGAEIADAVQSVAIDPVTTLYTAVVGQQVLERLTEFGHVVIFCDVDGLKTINDTQGHAAGDAYLRQAGMALRSVARTSDLCMRKGGDELLWIVRPPLLNPDQVLQRLQDAFQAAQVAVSMGIVVQADQEPLPVAIERADHAMYQNKADRKTRQTLSPSVASAVPPQQHGHPSSTKPSTKRRLVGVESHWRPAQPSQWDAPTPDVVMVPRRRTMHGAAAMGPQDAKLSSSEPVELATKRSAMTSVPVPASNPPATALANAAQDILLPYTIWVWGEIRRSGTSTTALALARWIAWQQKTPVRLLEGHFTMPGLARLIQTESIAAGWGWEASWTAGTPYQAPPNSIALADRLQVWALGMAIRYPHPERKWGQILKMMTDVVVIVDGGTTPPPIPVTLGIYVAAANTSQALVPSKTWIASRGSSPTPVDHRIALPAEPLGIEGIGSPAWFEAWTPLASVLGIY
ncbi:MAG: hypothetical protein C7B46_20180 [Sulfobacillus benefaciens]|uniref:GGDEF domain-containing protein n=1 Tax=Sulfobacillus benefaciens TaxID=453960 RepID=A0A2T2WVE3_9FIRM|nr:MAG: hypothetical protein C7B46_20180 [Sulfobacillus benefaciens]